MHVKKTNNSPTSVTLIFEANEADLSPIKQQAVARLGRDLKLQGFRPGKAPASIVEKNIDQSMLQTEVIEEAINHFYVKGLDEYRLRPVTRPEVSVKKFVPYTTLEFEAKADVVGEITLPDYTKLKKAKPSVKLGEKEVTEVVESLRTRLAERQDVERAAKDGDQLMIDFKGVDDKGEPVNGAEGKGYPLVLGSNTFIPGFEENLIGMKSGDEKTFTLKFPKEYNVAALASKDVTFTVTINAVQEVKLPKVDDDFATKAGPFKTVTELKADIKKQLTAERENEAEREYEQALIEEIASKAKVVIPDSMIEEQLNIAEQEEKQNLVYRGQTWEEHLEIEGVTEEEHRNQNRDKAALRVKAGLVLSEISEKEGLDVTPEELEIRVQLLKGQYQDATMQAELDKPENRREIAMRMLTEKTIEKLVAYAGTK